MAIITESFNKADSDTLGPDLTWTELAGDFDVVSNTCRTAVNVACLARADSNLSTEHFYVQAVIRTNDDANSSQANLIGRKDNSATETFYVAVAHFTNNELTLFKCIGGAFTQLGSAVSQALAIDTDYTLKLQMVQNTIKVYLDGVEKISQEDTDIDGVTVGGKRGGIRAVKLTTGYVQFDNFEAADVPKPLGPMVRPA